MANPSQKSTAQVLLEEIQDFLAVHDMAPTTFGELCARDRHLVRNLRAGKSVTTRRLDQCRHFMRHYRPTQPRVGPQSKVKTVERV